MIFWSLCGELNNKTEQQTQEQQEPKEKEMSVAERALERKIKEILNERFSKKLTKNEAHLQATEEYSVNQIYSCAIWCFFILVLCVLCRVLWILVFLGLRPLDPETNWGGLFVTWYNNLRGPGGR